MDKEILAYLGYVIFSLEKYNTLLEMSTSEIKELVDEFIESLKKNKVDGINFYQGGFVLEYNDDRFFKFIFVAINHVVLLGDYQDEDADPYFIKTAGLKKMFKKFFDNLEEDKLIDELSLNKFKVIRYNTPDEVVKSGYILSDDVEEFVDLADIFFDKKEELEDDGNYEIKPEEFSIDFGDFVDEELIDSMTNEEVVEYFLEGSQFKEVNFDINQYLLRKGRASAIIIEMDKNTVDLDQLKHITEECVDIIDQNGLRLPILTALDASNCLYVIEEQPDFNKIFDMGDIRDSFNTDNLISDELIEEPRVFKRKAGNKFTYELVVFIHQDE